MKRAAKRGVTLARFRELALALPETEEGTSYGTPGFRVKKRLFARVLETGETVVVRCDLEVREALLSSAPEAFRVTDHYAPHPWVLVDLARVDPGLLAEVVKDAWKMSAPPSVVAKIDAPAKKVTARKSTAKKHVAAKKRG